MSGKQRKSEGKRRVRPGMARVTAPDRSQMACLILTFPLVPPLLRSAAISEHHHYFVIHLPLALLAMSLRGRPSRRRIA